MPELETGVNAKLWGICLEAPTESNLLKTQLSKCQKPRNMQPAKLNICVCTCLYLPGSSKCFLDKRIFVPCFILVLGCINVCTYLLMPISAISNNLFSFCRLKINNMMKLQRCAFILEFGVAKNTNYCVRMVFEECYFYFFW
jgi:hypothetical protein